MKIGSTVRIVRDAEPELKGLVGVIEIVSDDGTAAYIRKEGALIGVWCSLSNLEEVQ